MSRALVHAVKLAANDHNPDAPNIFTARRYRRDSLPHDKVQRAYDAEIICVETAGSYAASASWPVDMLVNRSVGLRIPLEVHCSFTSLALDAFGGTVRIVRARMRSKRPLECCTGRFLFMRWYSCLLSDR